MADRNQILAHAPSRIDMHSGEVLLQNNFPAEALPHLNDSIRREPNEWRHYVNLSICYRKMGDYEEARKALIAGTNIAPECWPLYHTWAALLDDTGHFEDALQARWQAWELCERKRQDVAFGLALSLLRFGRWTEAWPFFELGRYLRAWGGPPGLPIWDGTPIQGKRLLVMAEGGYGDLFLFGRWLALLGGVDVTLCVWDKQIPILRRSPELANVRFLAMSADVDTNNYDLCTSIMSLPALFRSTPDSIPASLTFGLSPKQVWEDRHLGACWTAEEFGSPRKIRSIPGRKFDTLSTVSGSWASLVPGQTLAWMRPCPDTWEATAARIASLDVVVSVCTASAHLAGCLGVKTYVMPPVHSYWAWGLPGAEFKWYRDVTVIRSKKPDSWEEPLDAVRRLLSVEQ